MNVITHNISTTGAGRQSISIAPDHELPPHAYYLGVQHGEHDGSCECRQCTPQEYDAEVDDGHGGTTLQ